MSEPEYLICVSVEQGKMTIETLTKSLTRRSFIGSLAAVAAASGSPLSAHEEPPFELPQDFLPTFVEMDAWLAQFASDC